MEEDESVDQPLKFDLELELVRWVKVATTQTIPPVMVKPSGPIVQHYGLDSKSRWREAVCVMMLMQDPHITPEGVARLGRHLAQIFRQDFQLWEVKAKQLHEWVNRGLTNVKLLDRTLAYFQNQTSWLQYIKNLKPPIPKIESPGFPGTQWNEFYWKEQTVMLLMQEADFPEGKNPEFCARLFEEEPGKWRLKMEQFRRWLEKGKNDPLPEYYGTGKNCPECGLFLWDSRSFIKHMKRNHGLKVKEKDKVKEKAKEKTGPAKDETSSSASADPSVGGSDAEETTSHGVISSADTSHQDATRRAAAGNQPQDAAVRGTASANPTDEATVKQAAASKFTEEEAAACNPSPKIAAKDPPTLSDLSTTVTTKQKRANSVNFKAAPVKEDEAEVSSLLSQTLPVRSAASRKEPVMREVSSRQLVTCPECGYQCSHSKIIGHLKRCQKALQANNKAAQELQQQARIPSAATAVEATNPAETATTPAPSPLRVRVKDLKKLMSAESSPPPPDSKKYESDLVKKVFLKKFEADKEKLSSSSPWPGSTPSPEPQEEYKPPLKLKLSRKESNRETPCFEINKPIISSLLRPGWVELQKLARAQQAASPLGSQHQPLLHTRLSFSPPTRLQAAASPKEATAAVAAQPYSPISSPDLSTRSSPPPPAPSLPSPVAPKSDVSEAALGRSRRNASPQTQSPLELPTHQNVMHLAGAEEATLKSESEGLGGLGERGGRRRLLSCPLCGAEYALATTLEKHIDRDHREENSRRAKRTSRSADRSPPKKRRTLTPPPPVKASETPAMDLSAAERPKLTEYEIFQSLQLPADRKLVACQVCAQMLPPNTLKRHMARHEKLQADGDQTSARKQFGGAKRSPAQLEPCPTCHTMLSRQSIKRHQLKHKQEQAKEAAAPDQPVYEDDRIPCTVCTKMLPKNALKRHMMKHEAQDYADQDVGKIKQEEEKAEYSNEQPQEEDEEELADLHFVQEPAKRRKVACSECGLLCAPNGLKKHLEKHKKAENNVEEFAPIEITPTKEYWEMKEPDLITKNPDPKGFSLVNAGQDETDSSEQGDKAGLRTSQTDSSEQGDKAGLRTSQTDLPRFKAEDRRETGPRRSAAKKEAEISSSLSQERQGAGSSKPQKGKQEEGSHRMKEGGPLREKERQEAAVPLLLAKIEGDIQMTEARISTGTAAEEVVESENGKKKINSNCSSRSYSPASRHEEEVKTVNKNVAKIQEKERAKVSGSEEESESPLETAVRKVVSYKMTPKQALSIYNLTPKVLFDSLLGETDADRMAILEQVNLSPEAEDTVIQFCREHEEQLSYKSVINCVKDLKYKDGMEDFSLSRLEAYRWWYAFRKKFDLKITAKKK